VTRRRSRTSLIVAPSGFAAALALLAATASVASASASPLWRLDTSTAPTYLMPGREARVIATASNLGATAVQGSGAQPVTVTDTLPAHLQVPSSVSGKAIVGKLETYNPLEATNALECAIQEPQRKQVSCKTRTTTKPIAPYTELKVTIPVEVSSEASTGEQNTVRVSGGEPEASSELDRPVTVKDEPTPFGVERYELTPEEQDGATDTQAGSHPFQLTATLDLNQTLTPEGEGQAELEPAAPALARNLSFKLPPGLLGDPKAVQSCPDVEFSSIGENDVNACPANTAIGVALVTLNLPVDVNGVFTEAVPVFNLTPAPGEPARFGFEDAKVPVVLDTSVRTDSDYGVTVTIKNTTQIPQFLGSRVTFWGEPENPSHDASRGWACIRGKEVNGEKCSPPAVRGSTPFLTLPTACTGALASEVQGESWAGGRLDLSEPFTALEACQAVPFNPELTAQPVEEAEGRAPNRPMTTASTPTGMNVTVTLPVEGQATNQTGVALGESAVRDTDVVLPRGVQLSPSAANGLQACSEAEVGFEGRNATPDPFAPGVSGELLFSNGPASCPEASKVGTVAIASPDLKNKLLGAVYLARQNENPFGSLFALYIVAEDPNSGVRVKLAGEVSVNEQTGQITSLFSDTPQVPFEQLELHFFEGPHASLSTPPQCGPYVTTSTFSAWSGASQESESPPFEITGAPGGRPCPPSPLPFHPGLSAGSSNGQAGAFTPFTLTIANSDGSQPLTGVAVRLPTGIAALLSKVTPCPEPRAGQEWACGADSLIGHSTASAGLGPEPYNLPGQVYLTSGYDGAPFGLLVQTPAMAGPFNLGMVNVRSRINVDPKTAAVTITTDPGPRGEALPTRLKGIPAQIKQLNVTVDRPEFEFNPTGCEPKQIEATLAGGEGATATASSPFQVTGCQSLPFKPGVSASTDGKTSKADGASLDLTFTSHPGEAHVAKTILTIPATLPARLTTIQKACLAGVFEANPAGCPEGSDIGTAVVHTPVLKNPVAGPIYLVSHGNAAWPDAELVLQGEGITVILDGQTAIKHGVTTSSFLSVPDVPFESVEVTLPEGPHSALTMTPTLAEKDHYSLCGQSLKIPAALSGQNGTAFNESVKLKVAGCHAVKASKTKKLTQAEKLGRALAACRKPHRHARVQRARCERSARRRFTARETVRNRRRLLAKVGIS
jgi:hypothetical protein